MATVRHAGADVVVADNDQLVRELNLKTINDAADADATEHKMTLRGAWKTHKKVRRAATIAS